MNAPVKTPRFSRRAVIKGGAEPLDLFVGQNFGWSRMVFKVLALRLKRLKLIRPWSALRLATDGWPEIRSAYALSSSSGSLVMFMADVAVTVGRQRGDIVVK
jgi:hypothetical protein